MKIRILTGFAIGIVLLLALLFLPQPAVCLSFFAVFSLALYEIFLAYHFLVNENNTALGFCQMELLMIAFAAISVMTKTNYEYGFVIILCALVDVGGYTAGKLAGKKSHKVSFLRTISPNKSWEGYIAGITCSILLGLVLYDPLSQYLPENAKMFCFVAWAPAIMGDLFESKIKRTLQLDDSGDIARKYGCTVVRLLEKPISSHGGYLDRVDSFIFAIAAYGLFLKLMP